MREKVTKENLDFSLQETCTNYVSTRPCAIYIAPRSIYITVTNIKLPLGI